MKQITILVFMFLSATVTMTANAQYNRYCNHYSYTNSYWSSWYIINNPKKTCAYIIGENPIQNIEEALSLAVGLNKVLVELNNEPWCDYWGNSANYLKNGYRAELTSRIEECSSLINAVRMQQRRFSR